MVYQPSEKRFAAVLNRFDWELAQGGNGKDFKRRRTALRLRAGAWRQAQALRPSAEDRVLSLLAVRFEPERCAGRQGRSSPSPAAASIRLQVECIEAELKDLGPAWSTRSKPEHPGHRARLPERASPWPRGSTTADPDFEDAFRGCCSPTKRESRPRM